MGRPGNGRGATRLHDTRCHTGVADTPKSNHLSFRQRLSIVDLVDKAAISFGRPIAVTRLRELRAPELPQA